MPVDQSTETSQMKQELKALIRDLKAKHANDGSGDKLQKKLQKLCKKYVDVSAEFKTLSQKQQIKKLQKLKKKTVKLQHKFEKSSKSKTEKKREIKAQDKILKKSVKFNESQNEVFLDRSAERKWNDNKGNKSAFVQGKFKVVEIKRLMQALGSFAKENDLGAEKLLDMCSKPATELPQDLKAGWCKVAESLPNRSVQSIHNFCKRRFNPENYSGKWTAQEVSVLHDLVNTMGNSWKTIARTLNDQFYSESRSRTAENVKDKWKQIGGDNAATRVVGKWKLQDVITLIQSVEKATQIQILYPLTKIVYHIKEDEKLEKRFKIKENKITIYSQYVGFEEIMKHIVFDIKNVRSQLLKKSVSSISWSAVADQIKTKSSDDIRYYWTSKVLPLFIPNQNVWSEEEDLNILEFVVNEDLYGDNQGCTITQSQSRIRFENIISNNKSIDQCRQRWFVLLKSLGSSNPGQRIEPSKVAEEMIELIKNKNERYVKELSNVKEQAAKYAVDTAGDQIITEGNHFIDIKAYYLQNYM